MDAITFILAITLLYKITGENLEGGKEYDNGAQFKRTIFVYGKNLLDLAKQLYERACHV